jgi:arylsulfatase A-like enzyme
MPHELGIDANRQGLRDEARLNGLGHILTNAGYECVYGGKWHVPEPSIPDGAHGFRRICDLNDNKLAQCCIDFLRSPHGKPFFLVASFDNPHNICEWGRQQVLPWGSVPRPSSLEDCPNLPPNYAIPPFEPVVIREYQRLQPSLHYVLGFTPEDWRRHRYAYYRLVEKVDWEIGKLLAALRETGLDHGENNGAHRLNQKMVLYEEAVRVPLLISHKAITTTGTVDSTHPVSTGLDLFRTICDYADVGGTEHMQGLSLRPILEGADVPRWRRYLAIETSLGGVGTGRAILTEQFKYVAYSRFPYREQLFDLRVDPGEMVNLAVSSRWAHILDEHRHLLHDWCAQTSDTFGRPTYCHLDTPFVVPGFEFTDT